MRKHPIFLFFLFILSNHILLAQEKIRHPFPNGFTIVALAEGLRFYVDDQGQLLDTRFDTPYMDGDYEYYDRFDDRTKQGKIKRLRDIQLDYYGTFDRKELRGKLKSVNQTQIAYYDLFDGRDLQGRLKSIGPIAFRYHDRFDDRELIGKLKSVGNLKIEYYDRFDGEKAGKLKSITGSSRNVFVQSRNL